MITFIYKCGNNQHNKIAELRTGYDSNRKRKREKSKDIDYTPAGILDFSRGSLFLSKKFSFDKSTDDLEEKLLEIEDDRIRTLVGNYITNSLKETFVGWKTSQVLVCPKCLKYKTDSLWEIFEDLKDHKSFMPSILCDCGTEMEIAESIHEENLKSFFVTSTGKRFPIKCPYCGKSEFWKLERMYFSD